MNYRHAFHAGNHADVLKHVVLLALCDALTTKPAACFALDTHGGRGLYRLDGESAQKTGEALDGIARLMAEAPREPAIQRYLAAVRACRFARTSRSTPLTSRCAPASRARGPSRFPPSIRPAARADAVPVFP